MSRRRKERQKAQEEGVRQLIPGMYINAKGEAWFDVPEALAFLEIPDTPENRQMLAAQLAQMLRKTHPDVPSAVSVHHKGEELTMPTDVYLRRYGGLSP